MSKKKIKIIFFLIFINFWTQPLFALTVVVIQDRKFDSYKDAYTGFKQEIKKSNEKIDFIFYNLKKDNFEQIIRDIILREPELIFSLGEQTTRAIKNRVNKTPVIFCLVLNPVEKGLVECIKSTGNNLTGVCLDIPVATQFLALQQVIPSAKRIGVIYNPFKTNLIVEEGKKVAEKLGLQLISRRVYSQKEVPDVLKSFKNNIDVLWGVLDTTVFTYQSLSFILKSTLKDKLPVLGFSVNMVKTGALLSLYTDYKDMGRQAGEIALKIINGDKPDDISVSFPRKITMAINLKVAKIIEIDIPEKTMKNKDIKFFK
ncbi:ABC transporter substrate-binding protein [bacterium]|nr:ABC transporter substrate-binding protein [bacterium]